MDPRLILYPAIALFRVTTGVTPSLGRARYSAIHGFEIPLLFHGGFGPPRSRRAPRLTRVR